MLLRDGVLLCVQETQCLSNGFVNVFNCRPTVSVTAVNVCERLQIKHGIKWPLLVTVA